MSKSQIDRMVDRFLGWKLPADFAPDCGISFKRESDYEHPEYGRTKYEPVGTNLFTADQARQMFEYVLTDKTLEGLQPHERRVVAEFEDLKEKLSKLLAFFQGPTFPTLPEAERSRLRNQARFMDGYAAVLEERIAAFGG